MSDLSRANHRQRTRDTYLNAGAQAFQDHNLLEMLLFYAIPRKDVKPIAYALINRFGSLENIFNADLEDIESVDGVGTNTAILLKLVHDIDKRCAANRNNAKIKVSNFAAIKDYVFNLFSGEKNERLVVITLSDSSHIINTHFISEGDAVSSNVDPKKIVKHILTDNAPRVIVAHNHPQSSFLPSEADLRFTKKLSGLLNTMGITLVDHIIVGNNGTISLANDIRYLECFTAF